jgi:hypothetical protein
MERQGPCAWLLHLPATISFMLLLLHDVAKWECRFFIHLQIIPRSFHRRGPCRMVDGFASNSGLIWKPGKAFAFPHFNACLLTD